MSHTESSAPYFDEVQEAVLRCRSKLIALSLQFPYEANLDFGDSHPMHAKIFYLIHISFETPAKVVLHSVKFCPKFKKV